jgi:hypothetical protein
MPTLGVIHSDNFDKADKNFLHSGTRWAVFRAGFALVVGWPGLRWLAMAAPLCC